MTEERIQNRLGLLILAALVIAVTALIFSRPPIPQPASYHDFADQRTFFGVRNFMDVASNLAFLFVGVWGLLLVAGRGSSSGFIAGSEKWAYAVFFLGVALTFFGSSYYHLHPANATLVWDRLPMTLGFMAIVAVMVAERISARAGVLSLLPLVIAGAVSVMYWRWTEAHGHGDLRPYYLVQFGSLLAVLVMLIAFRARYTKTWCVAIALALYVGAKMLESFDPEIYALGHFVSGHTLKHLAAAGAAYFILLMLQRRRKRCLVPHHRGLGFLLHDTQR